MRLQCFNPSILNTEPPPVTGAQSIWLLSLPLIRAAFSRGSGFVLWSGATGTTLSDGRGGSGLRKSEQLHRFRLLTVKTQTLSGLGVIG